MIGPQKSHKNFRRAHLRAPLFTELLYEDDGDVLKASVNNISEGGVLLESLPHVPEINFMPLILDLPRYPIFSQMPNNRILQLEPDNLERDVIRVRAKIVRSFEAQSAVEAIFVPKIGCEFVAPTEDAKEVIRNYVEVFAKNMVYLLSLFENGTKKDIDLMRHIAGFLGYKEEEKLVILRQKVLHDYQSLESL